MLRLVTVICVLIACANAQQERAADVDDLIKDIFGEQPTGGDNQQSSQPPITSRPTVNSNLPTVESADNNFSNKSCRTDDERDGECVAYYLCNKDNSIDVNGEGVIDIRLVSACQNYLDRCCALPDQVDEPITPAPPKQNDEQPRAIGCGYRNKNGVGFQTVNDNNKETKFGEFPWMVAVLTEALMDASDPDSAKINVFVCGGSLIHPRVVLTAAHCVYNKTGVLRIRAGEWDTRTDKEIYKHQDRDVEEIVVHEHYYKGALFNNFALLFLKSEVTLAQHINTVCLPPSRQRTKEGNMCYAAGWGKDEFGKKGKYQIILKKIQVPAVENRKCQDLLRKTRLGARFNLHSSFMCAGGLEQDTCSGDGGSPLACPIEYETDRYEQYGIVSWGIGCGTINVPAVYADVSQARDWIDNQIIGHGYSTDTYTY